mmetsp:Transcript_18723/g.37310  ORF Transcript_18723/g.37310 Transcript_18723/m.37310 type:complete len:304 (+) Transcript_18723:132-1043(+)
MIPPPLNAVDSGQESLKIMPPADSAAIGHDEVTLALSKVESAEHLGPAMESLRVRLSTLNLVVRASPAANESAEDVVGEEEEFLCAKTVHFMRHGQGFHNLLADRATAAGVVWEQYSRSDTNPYVAPEILDAPLTHKGRLQASSLRTEDLDPQPSAIFVSPLCRALQTAVLAFGHLVGREDVPFLSHETIREMTGVHTCDQRRPIREQAAEFPMVDFGLHEDADEDGIFEEDRRESTLEVGMRIYSFLEWLSGREEEVVGVVSHSGWLMTLFNGVLLTDFDELKAWFQTGEIRSVRLVFSIEK